MPIRIYNDHSFTLSTFANMEDSRCQTPSQNNQLGEVSNFPTLKDNYRGKPTKRSAAVPLVMPSCNLSIFSWITNSYHVILQDQRFARRLNYVFSWRALLAGVSQEWVHILFLRIPELCFSLLTSKCQEKVQADIPLWHVDGASTSYLCLTGQHSWSSCLTF